MRNLKKILAMVLALIMSLSLMATAGAADFPDADKISEDYTVAVEVLNGLGVFKGYESGNFEPQGNITRAEVAAIIYRIATGDVNDAQTGIYSSWGMFEDVKDGQWYAGYVNYCANAGYIKGYNNRFDPNAQVTGYQALAMILRAVGYDKMGEFTGSNWQVNTASTARERGVLQNVSSGLLGQSATREMIAEILFRAILIDKVNYTPALGYQVADTSVGYDSLGLEDLSGVVEANEYADLYGSAPLKDGQTRLNVDGTKYVLETGSVLTDIGERRHAYVTEKGANVLYGLYDAETDYTVAEPAHDGGEGDTVADVARSQNLKLTDDTEYYVNFGEPIDKYTSDHRIEYIIGVEWTEYQITELLWRNGGTARLSGTDTYIGDRQKGVTDEYWASFVESYKPANDVKGKYTYDKVIKVGEEITAQDMIFIREIFYGSDSSRGEFAEDYDIYFGEVYVNTQSNVDNQGNSLDISDSISYNKFFEEYINDEFRDFSASDNGEWLKIVDYDQDGNADYVMRTDFVMTTTVDHNTVTDVWIVEYLDYETAERTEIDADDISGKEALTFPNGDMKLVSAGELVEGQVYMYTYIDGVYYITEPTMIETSVSKINYRAGTAECADGEIREWSGIERKAIQYYDDLAEVSLGTTYFMYLDQFGYIRLFTESDKGFVLLTDGYFETDRRDNKFKAQIWDDGEKVDIDVTDADNHPATTFIWSAADREDTAIYHDDEGTWQRLKEFGHVYYDGNLHGTDNAKTYGGHWADGRCDLAKLSSYGYIADPYATNVAAYTEKDGTYTLGTVDMANTSRAHYEAYAIDNTDLTNGSGSGTVYSNDRTLYGITAWNADGTVNKDKNVRIQTTTETLYYYVDGSKITSWTGYNSSSAPDRFQVSKAYAVGSYVPDRETNTNENTLPYLVAEIVVIEGKYAPTILAANFLYAMVDGGARDHYLLGEIDNGFGEKVGKTNNTTWNGLINFYDQAGGQITSNYEAYGVFAGRVVTYDRVKGRNYVQLSVNKSTATGARATNLNYGNPESWAWFYTDEIPVYNLTQNLALGENTLRAFTTRDGSNISIGDFMIYMTDKSGNVALAINVSESKDSDGNAIKKLDELWNAISADQIARYNALHFSFYGVGNVNSTNTSNATIHGVNVDSVVGKKVSDSTQTRAYGGSIYVTYHDARSATAWSASSDVVVKRWDGTNWIYAAPGVPDPAGQIYVAMYGDYYYVLIQRAGSNNVGATYTLTSTDHSKAIVNGNQDQVMVINPSMKLGDLESILYATKGGVTVPVYAGVYNTARSVYQTDYDTTIRGIIGNNDTVWVCLGEKPGATTANIQVTLTLTGTSELTFDKGVASVVDMDRRSYKSGDLVLQGTELTFTLTSGYELDTVKVNGSTATKPPKNYDGSYTLTVGLSDTSVEIITKTATPAGETLLADAIAALSNPTVIVSNSVYSPKKDVDLYKAQIRSAVNTYVRDALNDDAKTAGNEAKYANVVINDITVTAVEGDIPNGPNPASPKTVSVKVTLGLRGETYTAEKSLTANVYVAYTKEGTIAAIEEIWKSTLKTSLNYTVLAEAAKSAIPGLDIKVLDVKADGSGGYSYAIQYRFSYGPDAVDETVSRTVAVDRS